MHDAGTCIFITIFYTHSFMYLHKRMCAYICIMHNLIYSELLLSKSGTLSVFNIVKYYNQLSVSSLSNSELNWLRIKSATTMCYKSQSTISSIIYSFSLFLCNKMVAPYLTFLTLSNIWNFPSWIKPITKYSKSSLDIGDKFCDIKVNDI